MNDRSGPSVGKESNSMCLKFTFIYIVNLCRILVDFGNRTFIYIVHCMYVYCVV